jgi:hypothetical protein
MYSMHTILMFLNTNSSNEIHESQKADNQQSDYYSR